MPLLPARRRQVRCLRKAGPWSAEQDDLGRLRLQRAHTILSTVRFRVHILGLGLLQRPLINIKELWPLLPMKRTVSGDGLPDMAVFEADLV